MKKLMFTPDIEVEIKDDLIWYGDRFFSTMLNEWSRMQNIGPSHGHPRYVLFNKAIAEFNPDDIVDDETVYPDVPDGTPIF